LNFPILPFAEKLLPVVSKLSGSLIKKKLFFHELCLEYGIAIYEEDFDFVYLQALSIFLLDNDHDWALIFELPEVRSGFRVAYPNSDFSDFEKLLDGHLHTTIKKGMLKELDKIPGNLVSGFIDVYTKQVSENLPPSAMELKKEIREAKLESERHFGDNADAHQVTHDMLSQLISMTTATSIPSKQEYQQIIDVEHQAQLDLIKKSIDEGRVDSARKELEAFKERIWDKAAEMMKFKVLNNIGYTHMVQDKYDEAAGLYQQAIVFNPDDVGTLTNLAGIYFMRRKLDAAKPITIKLAESHPGLAAALVLYQKGAEAKGGNLEQYISTGQEENQDVWLALMNLYIPCHPRKALIYAKKLYDTDRKNDNFIDIYCNLVCVALIGEKIDFETTELLNSADKELLREVKVLLKGLWGKFSGTEMRRSKLPLLERISLLLTVLGEHEAAIATTNEELGISPDSFNGMKLRGMSLMFLKRYAEAAEQFSLIVKPDEEAIYDYLLAWLICISKSAGVTLVGEKAEFYLNKPGVPPGQNLRIRSALIFLYSEEGLFEDALKIADELEKEYPDDIELAADKARALTGFGKIKEANKYADKIIRLADDPKVVRTNKSLYLAANYLCVIEKFAESARIFEKFVDSSKDHYLTLQLAECYVRSGQKSKALTIYEQLRKMYGVSDRYTRHEVEIYHYYHDFIKATEVLSLYVEAFPEDIEATINLADLHYRLGMAEEVRKFIDLEFQPASLSLKHIKAIAQVMNRSGFFLKGLVLLYRFRRINPGAQINDFYMGHMLSDPMNREQTEPPAQVDENCVVLLSKGNTAFHYIIEDQPENDLIKYQNEINLLDPVYLRLKGKNKGGEIILNKNQRKEIWKITAIIPKFQFAFQEAMRENSTVYAANSALISGQIKNIEDIEGMINEQVEGREAFFNAIQGFENNYKSYQLPLSVFARFNHKSPIELYDHFVGTGAGIRYSMGNVQQYSMAVQLAHNKECFVLDITALLTLFKIGFKPNGLRLVIAHTTQDLIYNYWNSKEEDSRADHVTFFHIEGQKVRILVTAEEKQKALGELFAFKHWVDNSTRVLPCKALMEYDSDTDKKLKELIGTDVFETALLSKEIDGIFICDDAANRNLLEHDIHVNGVWTQSFLKSQVLSGKISEDDYAAYLYELCTLNHQHTTIDSNDLMRALKTSGYAVNSRLENVARILSGKYSDDQSISISFSVIAQLWKLDIPVKNKRILTYYLLMIGISYRCLQPLLIRINVYVDFFVVDYTHKKEIKNQIRDLLADMNYRFTKL
jgi:tetratricopeptide (TPR) repeat protein